MFKGLKHLSKALKHLSKALKLLSTALEHKLLHVEKKYNMKKISFFICKLKKKYYLCTISYIIRKNSVKD